MQAIPSKIEKVKMISAKPVGLRELGPVMGIECGGIAWGRVVIRPVAND